MKNHDSLTTPTEQDLRQLSLHEVTRQYGVTGLEQQFLQYVADITCTPRDQFAIQTAATVAGEVHAGQARGEHPYLTHLLRVSSRIIRHFGVTDPVIIQAALLHDSVEDQPGRLAYGTALSQTEAAQAQYQPAALEAIQAMFGHEVAELVTAVTNPVFDEQRDSHEQYREHVRAALAQSPKARIIKMSDFLDNCKGLHYNELPAPRVKRLADKYYPLIPVMAQYAVDPTTPLPEDGRAYIMKSLAVAKARCEFVTTGS